jgi:DNA-binding NtrC family response regulator
MNKILVVDDHAGICHSFKKVLGRHGYEVIAALGGEEALEKVTIENPDLVFMDVTMPKLGGLETLKKLKSLVPDLTVIMMTGYSTTEKAITAMKYGAYDYIIKPLDNVKLLALVKKAISSGQTRVSSSFEGITVEEGDMIIGKSPRMLEIYKNIGQVSESDVTVLLRGETGTGKELIAKAIYHHSRRSDKRFIPVNCAAIPDTLLESELFGHEKGAFTGADNRNIGKFEQSDKGTMFLDEIGDMPLSLQAKLLRVLQDGCFQRLGGKEIVNTDVRIIAATNKNITEMTKAGKFRDDLFWRLNVVSIYVPPLRERREDIEELVRYFTMKFNKELGKNIKGVSPAVMKKFMGYDWPGNVRELQSVINRAIVLCKKDFISSEDTESFSVIDAPEDNTDDIMKKLSDAVRDILQKGGPQIYRDSVSTFESLLVKRALELSGNNQALASRLLGISRNTLRSKDVKAPGDNLLKK